MGCMRTTNSNIPNEVDVTTVEEYVLPAHWASALFNHDHSGLSDEEQSTLTQWHAEALGSSRALIPVDLSDEAYFARTNDAYRLGGDVADYTFHRIDRIDVTDCGSAWLAGRHDDAAWAEADGEIVGVQGTVREWEHALAVWKQHQLTGQDVTRALGEVDGLWASFTHTGGGCHAIHVGRSIDGQWEWGGPHVLVTGTDIYLADEYENPIDNDSATSDVFTASLYAPLVGATGDWADTPEYTDATEYPVGIDALVDAIHKLFGLLDADGRFDPALSQGDRG